MDMIQQKHKGRILVLLVVYIEELSLKLQGSNVTGVDYHVLQLLNKLNVLIFYISKCKELLVQVRE